jgi:phytoene desaturase
MTNKKVIVIGAGVAGLAAAVRLAIKGFEVIVYEKNSEPGGKLTAFKKNEFCFDAGPSLFTAPLLIKELFDLAEEPMEQYFSYQKLPISFKYFYEDGTIVSAYANAKAFANELNEKLGEDVDCTINYFKNASLLYNNTGAFFLNNSLHKFRSYFNSQLIKAFKGAKFVHILSNLHSYNTSNFKNPKTVQLFNRFATYNGSNPYKAPAMLSMIPHLEINDGTYYPKGGMISITNALYQLCLKKGVQFNFDKNVESIIHFKNNVKGVVVDGENVFADTVISNCDVYFTYKKLLKNNIGAEKVLKRERSSSAVIFYWGISKEFKELGLHNILFTNNYEAEFDNLFNRKIIYNDLTVYINITSKCEPEIQAPAGKENWFVMVNAPSNSKIDWDELMPTIKQLVVEKINRMLKCDIESFIECEEVLHPSLIESKTSSYLGSLYGTSSNSKMAAFLRHPNFTNNYNGLYFVGGSVHPGGGIPLCLKSAKIVSELKCN